MLTASSSAEIFEFPPHPKPQPQPGHDQSFLLATKTWLNFWTADSRLKDRHKVLCARLCRYFNFENFQRTGELIAWPKWEILMADLRWSKSK
jgi:hypothetical protein